MAMVEQFLLELGSAWILQAAAVYRQGMPSQALGYAWLLGGDSASVGGVL